MLFLYNFVLVVLFPFFFIRLAYRSLKNSAYRQRIKERFGFIKPAAQAHGVWVHAVSVGESIAAIKLVKAMQNQHADQFITVTCGTPTASKIIQQQLGDSVYHVYLPFDYPGSVKRFITQVRPSVGIIMETELWPNLLHYAHSVNVKLMIASMSISDNTYQKYQYFPCFVEQTLNNIDHFAVQTEEDADRLMSLGVIRQKVTIAGSLKFELDQPSPSFAQKSHSLKQRLSESRTVWLAGSTHLGEDQIVLDIHSSLLALDKQLLFILAPRHPERFDTVYEQCVALFKTQRWSLLGRDQRLELDTQVLLLDTLGELAQFIAVSDWCFIGGSMVPIGGHNILEACQAKVPVLFGKYMNKSKQIARLVTQAEAGLQVDDINALEQACEQLLNNPDQRQIMAQNGFDLINQHQGALAKIIQVLVSIRK